MDPQHHEPRLVCICSGRNEVAAHILANYLNSSGVPATVNGNQTLLNLYPEDPTAMVGVLVAEEDAEAARRLIAERTDRRSAAWERLWRIQTRSRAYKFFHRSMMVLFIALLLVLMLVLVAGF